MSEEEGEIRCICGFTEDDGFTIQCEKCLVWQHAVCLEITQDDVPEVYFCERCQPRELHVEKAVRLQQKRKEKEKRVRTTSVESKKKRKEVGVQSPAASQSVPGELVRKRGRPRLSNSNSMTNRNLIPEPLIRKKQNIKPKFRFSTSFEEEYCCNFLDYVSISENRFTVSVLEPLDRLLDDRHPLLVMENKSLSADEISKLSQNNCISIKYSQFAEIPYLAQHSSAGHFKSEAEKRSLIATVQINAGQLISEINGLLCSAKDLDLNHRRHSLYPVKLHKRDKTPTKFIAPPFVFKVPVKDEASAGSIWLDCRDISSPDSRYVQFVCQSDSNIANAILRTVILIPDADSSKYPKLLEDQVDTVPNMTESQQESISNLSSFRLCIFATRPISEKEEIIIACEENYLQYPCHLEDSHNCIISSAVYSIDDFERSQTGDPDIPQHEIAEALLEKEKQRDLSLREEIMNNEIHWNYFPDSKVEYSFSVSSGDTEDDAYSATSHNISEEAHKINITALGSDEELDEVSSQLGDLETSVVPGSATEYIDIEEQSESDDKPEPRRVSLRDFMKQQTPVSAQPTIPYEKPEAESPTEAVNSNSVKPIKNGPLSISDFAKIMEKVDSKTDLTAENEKWNDDAGDLVSSTNIEPIGNQESYGLANSSNGYTQKEYKGLDDVVQKFESENVDRGEEIPEYLGGREEGNISSRSRRESDGIAGLPYRRDEYRGNWETYQVNKRGIPDRNFADRRDYMGPERPPDMGQWRDWSVTDPMARRERVPGPPRQGSFRKFDPHWETRERDPYVEPPYNAPRDFRRERYPPPPGYRARSSPIQNGYYRPLGLPQYRPMPPIHPSEVSYGRPPRDGSREFPFRERRERENRIFRPYARPRGDWNRSRQ